MQQKRILAGGVGSSSSVDAHKGWLTLWNVDVPGKVKVHVWRLMKNGLALGAELQRRRIKGGVTCRACGREETALHRFWRCSHAQQIWDYISSHAEADISSPPPDVCCQRDLLIWFLGWLCSVKESVAEITLMTLYQLWLARNEARDSMIEDPLQIAKRSIQLLEEWRNIHEPKVLQAPKPKERWLPLEVGWTKINAYGAMRPSSEKGGGGVAIRDHDGRFLAGACHFFPSLQDPEDAELRACSRAMGLAKMLKLQQIVLETDNLAVASKLNMEAKDRSSHGPLAEEIKRELRGFDNHVVKWVRRTANGAAHILAKEGCGLEISKTWFLFRVALRILRWLPTLEPPGPLPLDPCRSTVRISC
jgi:ribonuclease HI